MLDPVTAKFREIQDRVEEGACTNTGCILRSRTKGRVGTGAVCRCATGATEEDRLAFLRLRGDFLTIFKLADEMAAKLESVRDKDEDRYVE